MHPSHRHVRTDLVHPTQALADVYHDVILVCSAVRDIFLKRGGAARCECVLASDRFPARSDYGGHVRVLAGLSVWLRGINPWNKTIEDITQGLQRRREALEREVVHADRKGLHRQATEREWSLCTIISLH